MNTCATCGAQYDATSGRCPQCNRDIRSSLRVEWRDLRTILAAVGIALIGVGLFLPIVTLPFVGTVNYIVTWRGIAVALLLVVSAALVATQRFRGLLVTGGVAAALTAYTYVRLSMSVAEGRATMTDSPFVGLAEQLTETLQLEWGWFVLLAGIVFLLAAGVVSGPRPEPTTGSSSERIA